MATVAPDRCLLAPAPVAGGCVVGRCGVVATRRQTQVRGQRVYRAGCQRRRALTSPWNHFRCSVKSE